MSDSNADKRPSSSSLSRLKHFRYSPPLGGWGGDYDFLVATKHFADDAELKRLLSGFGAGPAVSLNEGYTDLGLLILGGHKAQICFTRKARRPEDENILTITVAMYVTEKHVAQALEIEKWLDANGIELDAR